MDSIVDMLRMQEESWQVANKVMEAYDDVKGKNNTNAERSAERRETINRRCSELRNQKAAAETKHGVPVTQLCRRYSNSCGLPVPKLLVDLYNVMYVLLSTPLVVGPFFYVFECKYGIAFEALAEELYGGSTERAQSLYDALECSLILLGASGKILRGEVNVVVPPPLQCEIQVLEFEEAGHVERGIKDDEYEVGHLSIRIEEKVIVVLSVVSLPNLASQLASPEATPLDLFFATLGMVLYVVAVLAAVFGFLLSVKHPRVWRFLVTVGSVSTVYAFFCSVTLYLLEVYRWLIIIPCVILLPAFYIAIKS